MRRTAWAAVATFLALLSGATHSSGAQDAPAIARWVPPAPDARHVFVLDSAHVLSDAAVRALQDSSRTLQASTGADVVWVTLPSLGGRAIEEASLYVGRAWKVGNAGEVGDPTRNRGLVILYVPDKRTTAAGANFRVEVGRGLEGTITDPRSRRISAAMRTELKAKHYDAAYALGWAAAAQLVRADWETAQRVAAAPAPVRPATGRVAPLPTPPSPVAVAIIVGLLLLALLWLVIRAISRRMPPAPPTIRLERQDDREDDSARRLAELSALSMLIDHDRHSSSDSGGSFSAGSDFGGSSGGSDGGSLGDGGGFSGGGSDDSI